MPWEIDGAMQGFGMAMGPYAVQDLSGLDIAYANRKRLGLKDRPDWRYVPIADRMVDDLGRLGRKTGAGWYDYPAGAAPTPSPAVEALILDVTGHTAADRQPPSPEAIVARSHAAMVAEAAAILEEGIAARPSDIDLVLIHGYGFPRWRGGPLFHADRIGLRELVARIDGYAAADPVSWRVPALLRQLANKGRDFASLSR
jgi:3-hydroxyacyl-CoA dehydrogenase